jgi:hypothetical protein
MKKRKDMRKRSAASRKSWRVRKVMKAARQGKARLGRARSGKAGHGAARQGRDLELEIQAIHNGLKQMEEKAETKPQITEEQNERST